MVVKLFVGFCELNRIWMDLGLPISRRSLAQYSLNSWCCCLLPTTDQGLRLLGDAMPLQRMALSGEKRISEIRLPRSGMPKEWIRLLVYICFKELKLITSNL